MVFAGKFLAFIGALVVVTASALFIYGSFAPSAGKYAYNAAPKFGGASFPSFSFVLGKESQVQIDRLVRKYNLVGANVFLTDFEKNQRPLLWYVSNENYPEFKTAYEKLQEDRKAKKVPASTLFGSEESLNAIIAKMLDGQHVCNPVTETFLYNVVPHDAVARINRVCYAVIPPYGGSMIGYLSVFIPAGLTEDQLADIRAAMIEVQLDIFNRDVRHIDVANALSTKDLDLQKELPVPKS